jgi:hypothetical protein
MRVARRNPLSLRGLRGRLLSELFFTRNCVASSNILYKTRHNAHPWPCPRRVVSASLNHRATSVRLFGFAQGPSVACVILRLRSGTGRPVRVSSASPRDRASRACPFGFAQGPGVACVSLRLRSRTGRPVCVPSASLRDRRSDAQGPSK